MPTTTAKQGLRKDVLKVNRVYFSPDGPIPISKTRAQRWIKNFNRMSAAGLYVPMPLEHQDEAKPVRKGHPYLKSSKNFGHLSKLGLDDDGNLYFECEINPNNESISGGRLKPYVSPEIVPGFSDEKIGDIRDCITHMALTDAPVNGEQSGNWYVEKLRDGRTRMSCKTEVNGKINMAKKPYDDEDDDELEVDDEAIRPDNQAGDDLDDEPIDDLDEFDDFDDMDDDVVGDEFDDYPGEDDMGPERADPRVMKAVDEMAEFGVVLPEDTLTVDDFIERMCVAVKALSAAGIQTNSAASGGDDEDDEFENDQDDDYFGGSGRNNSVQEEQGAVLMSTNTEERLRRLELENRRLRREQELSRKEQRMSRQREAEQARDSIQERIVRYRELGKIPADKAKEMVSNLETVQMSFGSSGRRKTAAEHQLDVYDEVPAGTFSPVTRAGHRLSLQEHTAPTGMYSGRNNRSASFFEDDDKKDEKKNKVTEEMAKMVNIDLAG